MGRGTYDTKSVSIPPIGIIHRGNINFTPVHDIVIRDHDPRERSQEYSVSVHESEESLDARRAKHR